jgi:aryl-alcohol dehydrogenase-like predicted oxidoreductase
MVMWLTFWQPIAKKLAITQSQLALAWCLKNPHVSAIITGASRPGQVVENCAALKALDKISSEVMAEIDKILRKSQLDPARQD